MNKRINIKNIVTEEVRKHMKNFINENIRLITEKWSLSEEVQEATEKVLSDLHNTLYKSKCSTIIKHQLCLYQGVIQDYKLFDKSITVNYYVYECINDEICNLVYNEGYHIDGFDEETNELNLTLYMVQSRWSELYSEKNVAHELEHILQIKYGELNNKQYNRLTNGCYDHASEIIRKSNCNSKYELILAKLFYYNNPHEQDAFLQEYGVELKYNLGHLLTKNTELHTILSLMKEYYTIFQTEKDNFRKAILGYKIFGYTYNTMLKMFAKGIQRLEKKMQKVEQNFTHNLKYSKGRNVI